MDVEPKLGSETTVRGRDANLEKKKTMTMIKISSQKTCYTQYYGPLKIFS